jgi:hypothetical protein
MGVALDLPAQRRLVLSLAPTLSERQKKALLAGQPVYRDIWFPFQGQDVSVVRYQ